MMSSTVTSHSCTMRCAGATRGTTFVPRLPSSRVQEQHVRCCPSPRLRSIRAHYSYGRDKPPASQDAQVLECLTADLLEHCSTLSPANRAECASLQAWFEGKCQAAMSDGGANQSAQSLRQFLRELAMCGSMHEIYNSLQVMKHLEEKQACGQLSHATPRPCTASPLSLDAEGRALLVELFNRADTDNNGRLTWSEFNKALHFIGDSLCEEDQELVGSALDLQGSVTLEQFLAIVEQAEAARAAPASDSRFLRHLTHHQPSDIDHVYEL